MSVNSTIRTAFEQVAVEQDRKLAALTDEVKLIDWGLDSPRAPGAAPRS